jgi:hypothetical protein
MEIRELERELKRRGCTIEKFGHQIGFAPIRTVIVRRGAEVIIQSGGGVKQTLRLALERIGR